MRISLTRPHLRLDRRVNHRTPTLQCPGPSRHDREQGADVDRHRLGRVTRSVDAMYQTGSAAVPRGMERGRCLGSRWSVGSWLDQNAQANSTAACPWAAIPPSPRGIDRNVSVDARRRSGRGCGCEAATAVRGPDRWPECEKRSSARIIAAIASASQRPTSDRWIATVRQETPE